MLPSLVPLPSSDRESIEDVYRLLPNASNAEWEDLWTKVAPDLYKISGKFLRYPEDRMDAVMTTLQAAYELRMRLAGKTSPRAYCYAILRSVCLKIIHGDRRRSQSSIEDLMNVLESPADILLINPEYKEFEESLSETKRTILNRLIQGYWPREIAEQMGTTPGVISSRLSEIRKAGKLYAEAKKQ